MRWNSGSRVVLRPRIDRKWTPNMICGLSYVVATRQAPNSRKELVLCVQACFEQGKDGMGDQNSEIGLFTIEISMII